MRVEESTLRKRVQQLLRELAELEARVAKGDVGGLQERAHVGRRVRELAKLRELAAEYDRCQGRIAELERVRESGDEELLKVAQEEAVHARSTLPRIEESMRRFLLPPDRDDDRSVILEIRAGTGGEEAALFAGDLLRLYLKFAESRGWATEVLSTSVSDLRGVREAICRVLGVGAYGTLKHESGVHRIQRIPVTEAKGRIHTSTATVAVLPEAEEIDIAIAPGDLRIDTFTSSGPGGQSVNTTYSAVRVTHLPTGTVVTCQDEKSQQKNKQKALSVLRSRLYAAERDRRARERGEIRSGQIGTGERAEKIRTYNVPQDRLTDHRLDRSFGNLPSRFAGEIGDIVDALREWEVQQRLQKA